ncbi:MAG: extracellular solute-binding protein [Actinomycetota bacterium]|nr:extracellular solute-binding protein [Actinomycetota bacterium]
MTHHRMPVRVAALSAASTFLVACGGGFSEGGSSDKEPSSAEGEVELRMLIASSGDAETAAVNKAVDAWEKETGNKVTVTPAQDMTTELSKTFASSDPYDLMYIDAGRFATYAETGALYAYGDSFEAAEDVYPALKDTFTYEDEFYCVPKDSSTLGLIINADMWKEAGLTEADYPASWDDLAAVAEKLTTPDHVGLAMDSSRDRVGAFMVQAGGWLVNEDSTEATADSDANVEALTYLQGMLQDGSMAWSADIDAGWGGEALGTEKAAMTVEGNWIAGAMSADYPDIDYTVAELPEGPEGKGTLTFTQCWGVASKSDAQAQAIDLIASLTEPDQQMVSARAFGVLPAVESSREEYLEEFPENQPFLAGSEYAQGPISLPDFEPVLADFDSELAGLEDGDPEAILQSLQENASAALGG